MFPELINILQALLIAIHAMEDAHRGTMEALNKTVVVTAKEKIAAVATILENVSGCFAMLFSI